MTQSSQAFNDLLSTLTEVGSRFAGEEWGIEDPTDVAEALGAIIAHLGTAIETQFDDHPARPVFRELVTPWRKSLGDNADARYHDAGVHPSAEYVLTGRTAGAVYVSMTVEEGPDDGSFPTATGDILNDTRIDIADDGHFEIKLGGTPPPDGRNYLALDPEATRVTIRHYWETEDRPAQPPAADLALTMRMVAGNAPDRPRAPSDETIAASISRIATYVRSRTLDTILPPGSGEPPPFVSRDPHVFPHPVPPGEHAMAAGDAAYSMAPYLLNPDEALVITARWPDCRCANVNLWNRQMQTFDYLSNRVSLNRAETVVNPNGSITVVVSSADPGVPNWLDTEGRPFGLVFWRYMLPEGPIERPTAEVVQLDSLR